ncbi:MAG: AlpA family phage regulatory protein [Nitrospiraceae bacterium]|nr:AlpA family phage regulatory protein [Nitrospiraceae bacterium]
MQTQTSEAVFVTRRRERLLRLREVLDDTGLSRAGHYRLIDTGRFPYPVKLTRRSVA